MEISAVEAECLASLAGAALLWLTVDEMSESERECRKEWHRAAYIFNLPVQIRPYAKKDFGDLMWQEEYCRALATG